MNLKIKKSYLVPAVIFAFVLMSVIILGSDTAYAASGGETKLYKAAFSYKTYLCDNTTESLHSSGSGVTSCTADSSEYGTSDICFDIYGSSYKGEGTLNGGYLNSSSVHVIANTGWSTSSIKLVNQAGTVIKTGTVSLSAAVDDGEYRVIYEGTGQGWLVNQREYKHYKIVCEFSFGVDTVSPTVTGITTDLTYVNGSVTVGAEDGLSGISALYMKNPQSSAFTKVTAPYTVSKEDQNGKYTFYSEDMAGNRSQDYVVFLDTEKPKIKVKKNGYETSDIYVPRGISVSVTDNGETDTVYISENGSEYRVFSGSLSENTELKFKATDKAGNVSDERTVYIDTEAPQGKILNGEGKELNGAFISTQSGIKYMAEDTGSGLKKRMMKAPGSSSYREYNGFIQFDEGEYNFYSEDNAGNRSAEMTVTVDNTKPSVKAFAGENEMNGKYSSASYIKFYAEDTGGIESVNLTVDGIKTEYTPMAQLKEEGRYTFYAVDKAGNKSASVTVILDRTAPSGDIFAGGIYTDSGISNKESFFVSVYDTCSEVKSILVSKDKGEYVNYENQSVIYDEGYYAFIFTDNAGNESEILYYILDRTAPDVTLYDDNGYEIDLYSSTNVQFSCQDNFGVSGTYIKSQSDLSYRNYMLGEELKDGHYYFYSEDMAGNVSDIKEAVIDTFKPTLSVYSGDTNVNGVNFVNNTIRVYGYDENTISIFVLLPGEKEYIAYNEGNILSMEGTYSFKASDAASNVSDILTITIDKT
ncbi:MAG: hypothetical protein MJ068_05095, partial [Clostridia bacterium]|nr:hypothetical protein [Clostridia bacterium]